MLIRPLFLILAFSILWGRQASAQPPQPGAASPRIDILTGEPVRPRTAHPHPEPTIVNAPHAPLPPRDREAEMPLEIYIAPQIGIGTGTLESGGSGYAERGSPLPRRSVRRPDPSFEQYPRLRP